MDGVVDGVEDGVVDGVPPVGLEDDELDEELLDEELVVVEAAFVGTVKVGAPDVSVLVDPPPQPARGMAIAASTARTARRRRKDGGCTGMTPFRSRAAPSAGRSAGSR